jgi:hypothetical protein
LIVNELRSKAWTTGQLRSVALGLCADRRPPPYGPDQLQAFLIGYFRKDREEPLAAKIVELLEAR